MPKKKNIKRILIISAILLVVILVVRGMIMDAIERANQEEKVYTSISDFQSIKEIAEYMGCTYIKEQDSKSENYDVDIYLKFKYQLYTEEASNEDYYYRMMALMLGYLNYQSIRLIDQENDIVIAIQADSKKQEIIELFINGQSNFFATQDTLKSIEKYQTFDIVDIETQSRELIDLIENKWITEYVEFGTKETKFDEYDIYFDEGIEVKTINKKVFNIIFTEKYEKEVVNGIKVNTTFEEIEKTLGTPTFIHKNYVEHKEKDIGYIGYKGKEFYIFFSENEISIYRIEEANTSTGLADAISSFNTDGELRTFVSRITDMWPDYDYYVYNEEGVRLEYTLRGLKIVFAPSDAGIYVYNNYNGYIANGITIENIIKDIKLLPNNVNLQIEEDLVDQYEKNRKMIYNDRYGNARMGTPDYSTEEFKIMVGKENITFISKNRKYVNSGVKKKSDFFIIYSDTEFIFNDENNILYKYNATKQELNELSEDNNILTINNKKILYLANKGLYEYDLEKKELQQILQFENKLTGMYDYDGENLIIGIKNTGIYKYNIITKQIVALVEGQAEFNITTIYEDKVFYDETLTLVK